MAKITGDEREEVGLLVGLLMPLGKLVFRGEGCRRPERGKVWWMDGGNGGEVTGSSESVESEPTAVSSSACSEMVRDAKLGGFVSSVVRRGLCLLDEGSIGLDGVPR